jgi:NAD+ diphosphatase
MPPDFKGPLAYTGARLDRASERRRDRAIIESALARPDARAYVLCGERIVLANKNGALDPLFPLDQAAEMGAVDESVFMGLVDEAARVAHAIAPAREEALKAQNLQVRDLRSLALEGVLPPAELGPLAMAKAVLGWHARHRFCAACGAPTATVEAGWRRDCGRCEARHFPRTDPCVIMLVTDGERCLLASEKRFPERMWSCLAGFLEPGESIEEAVRRETFEEAGVRTGRVAYFASQPWPYPMSLMIGCLAAAETTALTIDKNELADARWFGRDEARSMLDHTHPEQWFVPPPLAIAHHLVRAFVERGAGVFG